MTIEQQSVEKTALQIFASIPIDELTGGLKTITTPHAEVHEGHLFSASYKSPEGSDVADNAAVVIHLKVGSGLAAHLLFDVAAGGNAEVEFYEGPTTSNDGTGLPEVDLNRTTKNTSTLKAFHTPTVTGGANGIRLAHFLVPGGAQGPSRSGGIVRIDTEWILAKDTAYLIIVTNRSGGGIPISILPQWYEHA